MDFKTAAAAIMMLAPMLLLAGCAEKGGSETVGSDVVTIASPTPEATASPIPEAAASPAPGITFQPEETAAADPNAIRLLGGDELDAVIARNVYSSEKQRIMVESALSLIGKVSYFWGGKSYYKGFDPEWGKPYKVTSKGDPTTGETLPYGLDCSGFISWCGVQLGKGAKWTSTNIGEGTWHQWSNSAEVEPDDIRPGDIVFQNAYPGAETQHVGIVVGFLENGDPVIVHCSATEKGVVASTTGDVFNIFRRFKFMEDG